jgi:thymidine phosphorylase
LGTHTFDIVAQQDGKVQAIDLHNVNQISRRLGCPTVNEAGMYLHKKLQDSVQKGEVLYTMYANDSKKIELAKELEATKPAFKIV